jgi:hypothetical protein
VQQCFVEHSEDSNENEKYKKGYAYKWHFKQHYIFFRLPEIFIKQIKVCKSIHKQKRHLKIPDGV